MATETTEWADIPGWVGYYQASRDGQIRSVDRTITRRNGSVTTFKGRILAQKNKECGRNMIMLARDGKKLAFYVSKLVAMSFPE